MEASVASNAGRQSLHVAAERGHVFVAEHLTSRGAEASSASNDGWRPLHFAANRGCVFVAEHLARRGAEVSSAANDGGQPLHVAVVMGHFGSSHLQRRQVATRQRDQKINLSLGTFALKNNR